jgi:hypothetical protein
MAWAKYKDRINVENTAIYDTIHNPGAAAPTSGIFRCVGCGATAVAETNRRLPPQNHHQHTLQQGAIRWQLLVRSTHTHPTV